MGQGKKMWAPIPQTVDVVEATVEEKAIANGCISGDVAMGLKTQLNECKLPLLRIFLSWWLDHLVRTKLQERILF